MNSNMLIVIIFSMYFFACICFYCIVALYRFAAILDYIHSSVRGAQTPPSLKASWGCGLFQTGSQFGPRGGRQDEDGEKLPGQPALHYTQLI